MKIQITVSKTVNIPVEKIDVEKLVKSLFKRAKKIGEAEIGFGKESYVRVSDDNFSYVDLNVEDGFKTGGCFCMGKRTEQDIIYILNTALGKKL